MAKRKSIGGFTEQQLDDILRYPDIFGEVVLGIRYYPKQKAVLRAMADPAAFVAYMCCNSGGKTSRVVSTLVCWHLFRYPKGKIVATSGASRQLIDQMIPAINKFKDKFPAWIWLPSGEPIRTPQGGFFRAFTTNKQERAEGDHADEGSPLLYIVDEAKGVPEWLKLAVMDRVQPTRMLLCSSPGYAEGWFYEACTSVRSRFRCFSQTAAETPHIDPRWIADLRERWKGNPDVASSVLGEGFMGMVEGAIIDFRLLNECINNPPEYVQGTAHAFCDFAWSGQDGDENVLALKRGNKATIEDAFYLNGLQPVCDRFVEAFRRIGLSPNMISGDNGGGGKLIIDRLKDMRWSIHRVTNQAKAKDDVTYASAAAEMWYEFAKMVASRSVILPDDPELRSQLLNRKRITASKGRLAIESKQDMRERGVPSPDRADGIVGCFSRPGSYLEEAPISAIQAAGPSLGWKSMGMG